MCRDGCCRVLRQFKGVVEDGVAQEEDDERNRVQTIDEVVIQREGNRRDQVREEPGEGRKGHADDPVQRDREKEGLRYRGQNREVEVHLGEGHEGRDQHHAVLDHHDDRVAYDTNRESKALSDDPLGSSLHADECSDTDAQCQPHQEE